MERKTKDGDEERDWSGHEGTLIAGSKRNAPRGSRGNKTHCFPWPCGVTTFEADFFRLLVF